MESEQVLDVEMNGTSVKRMKTFFGDTRTHMKYVHVHIIVLGIHMRSGPHANSMHLRHGRPSCARACQLMTFLIVMDTYVHHENRSLIQSLPLMSLEINTIAQDHLYDSEHKGHTVVNGK